MESRHKMSTFSNENHVTRGFTSDAINEFAFRLNRFVWSLAIQTLMHAPKFEEPTRFNLYFKNIFDSQYLFRSPVLCTKKIFLSTAVSSFGYLFLLYLLHSVDNHGSRDSHLKMLTFSSVMKIMENCRTKTSFIYTVENIVTSYIVFFSAIITSTICLLDLS
jgi:hypothetical protein